MKNINLKKLVILERQNPWIDSVCPDCFTIPKFDKTCVHGKKRHPSFGGSLSHISFNAWRALDALDQQLVGTRDYMGMAYFWSSEYKHYLREVTRLTRLKVHTEMLDKNMDVGGESDAHLEIVVRWSKKDKEFIKNCGE